MAKRAILKIDQPQVLFCLVMLHLFLPADIDKGRDCPGHQKNDTVFHRFCKFQRIEVVHYALVDLHVLFCIMGRGKFLAALTRAYHQGDL